MAMLFAFRNLWMRLKASEKNLQTLSRRLAQLEKEVADRLTAQSPPPRSVARPWSHNVAAKISVDQTSIPEAPSDSGVQPSDPPPLAEAPVAVAAATSLPPVVGASEEQIAPAPAASPLAAKTAAKHGDVAPALPLVNRFENLFGRTLPIWAGGLTLAIAGLLIVRYAIDAGFFAQIFTPTVQIFFGAIFGAGLIGAAEYAWRNDDKVRDPRIAQALSGAGISTLYTAILVAANVYGLIGQGAAFILLAIVTASAMGLAMRFGLPTAILSLIAGLSAPALVGSLEDNIPILTLYLAVTIAGLAGVSRGKMWPWLALAALVGGMGWGLWITAAGTALDMMSSLSVGLFILMLAVAFPMFAYHGPRSAAVQVVAAGIGALQLGLFVTAGGFSLLHWSFFVLIAAAGQWLIWRDRSLSIIGSISLLLSWALLSPLWPDPSPFWFAIIGGALLMLHAVPLVARLWTVGEGWRSTVEYCLIGLSIPLLSKMQFDAISDAGLALLAMGGAVLMGVALWRGWAVDERHHDARFAVITGTAGLLAALAMGVLTPLWMLPLVMALVAAGVMIFASLARDPRTERVSGIFLIMALAGLLATQADSMTASGPFYAGNGHMLQSMLRWGALAAAGLLLMLRAGSMAVSRVGQIIAAAGLYFTCAEVVPAPFIALLCAIGGAALLVSGRRYRPERLMTAALIFALINLAWAAESISAWGGEAAWSLVAVPFDIRAIPLGLGDAVQILLLPSAVYAAALVYCGDRLAWINRVGAMALAGVMGSMALHICYRLIFLSVMGDDFVTSGVLQRMIWSGLIMAVGWSLYRRGHIAAAMAATAAATVYSLFYSLILHNPLWADQAVGVWPLGNLLVPLYGLAGWGVWQLVRMNPWPWLKVERAGQIITMLLVSGFAWSVLRQIFHGSLLTQDGVTGTENILRSVLLVALAIGFLLWGIRRQAHDWRIASLILMIGAVGKVFLFDASGLEGLARIASFIVLGFSLIGIGWLYSRQLAPDQARRDGEPIGEL